MFGLFKKGKKPKTPDYKIWGRGEVRTRKVIEAFRDLGSDVTVVLVPHFDETLHDLCQRLETEGLAFEQMLEHQTPADLGGLSPGLYVVQSFLLQAQEDESEPVAANGGLNLFALEPHFISSLDTDIARFASQIEGSELEHHAALDEGVLTMFAGEKTIELLKRAGHKDDDCLERGMITRALTRAQQKVEQSYPSNAYPKTIGGWLRIFNETKGY